MATIQTLGTIESLYPAWSPLVNRSSIRLYDQFNYDYATLYRLQPNVRTCIDFLARNLAQLGLHAFRRISDLDRERLSDHAIEALIKHPLPPRAKVTRYRLFEALMSDLGIYFNAYWLKFRQNGQVAGLLRVPPIYITPKGSLIPKYYELSLGGSPIEIPPEDIVHIRGYNPENPISGLSPLETLRRILAEEWEAGQYRENFWQNAARKAGIVRRPIAAPEWSKEARERFMSDFQDLYSGEENSGKTVVLEEGMEWQDVSFNAQESEYLGSRKLTREECARSYHIPLPMVGILEHATLTNIREQHQNLYQDCLGPHCVSIEEDLELQLLPEFEDTENVYLEFNLLEKLKGDFEEQVKTYQSAVGRPWMTPNEARARMNMPQLGGDADQLATPLNVIVGGQASPQDSAPKTKALEHKRYKTNNPEMRKQYEKKWTEILSRHYKRQGAAIVSSIPTTMDASSGKSDIGGVWWDEDRWNAELSADLLRLNLLTAHAYAEYIYDQMGIEMDDWETFDSRMLAYLTEHSQLQAQYFNQQTRDAVTEALQAPDVREAVKNVFETALTVWIMREVVTAVTSASMFGSFEAAKSRNLAKKTWIVTSMNPRPTHQAIDGMEVSIREYFPNGCRWPGDSHGGADEVAGCTCVIEFE